VRRWADDDLRSLNGHIEYLLREALRRAGRHPRAATEGGEEGAEPTASSEPGQPS
jgi:hypothetical protein